MRDTKIACNTPGRSSSYLTSKFFLLHTSTQWSSAPRPLLRNCNSAAHPSCRDFGWDRLVCSILAPGHRPADCTSPPAPYEIKSLEEAACVAIKPQPNSLPRVALPHAKPWQTH